MYYENNSRIYNRYADEVRIKKTDENRILKQIKGERNLLTWKMINPEHNKNIK